jgi:hypothetical protein
MDRKGGIAHPDAENRDDSAGRLECHVGWAGAPAKSLSWYGIIGSISGTLKIDIEAEPEVAIGECLSKRRRQVESPIPRSEPESTKEVAMESAELLPACTIGRELVEQMQEAWFKLQVWKARSFPDPPTGGCQARTDVVTGAIGDGWCATKQGGNGVGIEVRTSKPQGNRDCVHRATRKALTRILMDVAHREHLVCTIWSGH